MPQDSGLIFELFRDYGIPVMKPVVWGERRAFGWSISGFILVEEVGGKEFIEVYRAASLRSRRRLMWVHGEVMGTLHQWGNRFQGVPAEFNLHFRGLCNLSEMSGNH
jgi:hypothetical protein